MIPFELHQFLLGTITPRAFRDWLYANPEAIEPWFHPDVYLRLLELDYDDRIRLAELREDLAFVPVPPRALPIAPATDEAELLLNAIRRAPDDPTNYLVFADYLQQLGDPRGQLIVLDASLLRRDPYFIERARAETLQQHAEELLGPALGPALGQRVKLDWFLGFVTRATVVCETPKESAQAVRSLFTGHPSFALLREVVLKRDEMRSTVEAAVDELARVSHSTLSSIRIVGADVPWARSLGDIGALWAAHPRLRFLELDGYTLHFGEPALPDLLAMKMLTSVASGRLILSRIFECALPSLERLDLRIDGSYDDDEESIVPIEVPGALGTTLSSLRHLSLRAPDTDAFWQRLVGDPLLPRLVTLEASIGSVGLGELHDFATRFQHLERLELFLTASPGAGVLARLREKLPKMIVRD